jgi:hypothetical protein
MGIILCLHQPWYCDSLWALAEGCGAWGGGCAAYYRGAMGIILVYDVTDEASFNNVRNWIRSIEENASQSVQKVRNPVEF